MRLPLDARLDYQISIDGKGRPDPLNPRTIESGIGGPKELAGKRIGVPEYQMTAPVWIRGILQDEYGVEPSGCEYWTGGEEEPGRERGAPEIEDAERRRGQELEGGKEDREGEPAHREEVLGEEAVVRRGHETGDSMRGRAR